VYSIWCAAWLFFLTVLLSSSLIYDARLVMLPIENVFQAKSSVIQRFFYVLFLQRKLCASNKECFQKINVPIDDETIDDAVLKNNDSGQKHTIKSWFGWWFINNLVTKHQSNQKTSETFGNAIPRLPFQDIKFKHCKFDWRFNIIGGSISWWAAWMMIKNNLLQQESRILNVRLNFD